MVLFDEDPVTLIAQTTTNFHTRQDLDSLSRISSSLSTLRSARSLRLQASHSTLSQLSRKLHHLSTAHESEVTSHDAGAHGERIMGLDSEKFRVAKQASEVEIEGERMEGELRGLRRTLEALESEGVDGRAEKGAEDETV